MENTVDFSSWLSALPHKHKVVVAGNHDEIAEKMPQAVKECLSRSACIYLEDSSIEIDGVIFYGSPWTPEFMDWSFMKRRGQEIAEVWDKIPDNIDILITHGPPVGIRDNVNGVPQGCSDLLCRLQSLNFKAHIFGHIHEEYGMSAVSVGPFFINASICTGSYEPINAPICFEI